ncbi:DNA-3-methyladenine glycosylase family protein [Mariluticola halotolerans]|uniref:DNA-3-methyladenine glycosylase family protein n=1 Tax=Mariluticola halotolerans TaxID=2909283 RepID=UPI0026E38BE1|nr:DNA-3-methyladenine glycosylase 2 family protein [Mariluticola halotolerans]UJQ93795.1 DNA-3-methyladenine glycosylase 2 family protein [Mariluticola halotolerans]
MADAAPLERIIDARVLEHHLERLVLRDSRLAPIWDVCGEVPLRLSTPGFAGMAQIIVSQLLSVASARTIHGRLCALLDEVTPERFLAFDEERIRGCGLTGGKYRALCAVAEAELDGSLDYAALGGVPLPEAMAGLTRLTGIGPWTAEIYLLFATGHPDIFPAGDLVLRKMAGRIEGLGIVPDIRQTTALAAIWSPYRGAAARLLWRYFAVLQNKEGINL